MSELLERTAENIRRRNMDAFIAADEKEACSIIEGILPEGCTVSSGGSVTLIDTGVVSLLRSGKYDYRDRDAEGISREERHKIMDIDAKLADFYFMSSNAVTEEGELYNVDWGGNRVAVLAHSTGEVILVVGRNKIVPDLPAAIERVQNIAAPMNAQRKKFQTPCAVTGKCVDCRSPKRICAQRLITSFCEKQGRIKVILIDKDFGF